MRICIYGAGAIGGLLGAKLARAGCEVTLIARGEHLDAMRSGGLTVQGPNETFTVFPNATDDPAQAGPQDYVIVTLKAPAAAAMASRMTPLLGPKTSVVSAVNGVPWWYFHQLEGPHGESRLQSVDPGGRQWKFIGPERVIGCVVYPSAEVTSPGHVTHLEGDRFTLGEPDGSKSKRVVALSEAMNAAGLKAPVKTDIRPEIWVKLWGNAVFNPMSVLTGATLKAICEDPLACEQVRTAMNEIEQISSALGIRMPVGLDKRIAGARAVGEHKTSMLQDVERGRPVELEAIVGAVLELARMTGTSTPTLNGIYALTRLRVLTLGLPC